MMLDQFSLENQTQTKPKEPHWQPSLQFSANPTIIASGKVTADTNATPKFGCTAAAPPYMLVTT
jgi:hypothetical protein